jgi:hypothetical protein
MRTPPRRDPYRSALSLAAPLPALPTPPCLRNPRAHSCGYTNGDGSLVRPPCAHPCAPPARIPYHTVPPPYHRRCTTRARCRHTPMPTPTSPAPAAAATRCAFVALAGALLAGAPFTYAWQLQLQLQPQLQLQLQLRRGVSLAASSFPPGQVRDRHGPGPCQPGRAAVELVRCCVSRACARLKAA